jgi:hypothetical protein
VVRVEIVDEGDQRSLQVLCILADRIWDSAEEIELCRCQ